MFDAIFCISLERVTERRDFQQAQLSAFRNARIITAVDGQAIYPGDMPRDVRVAPWGWDSGQVEEWLRSLPAPVEHVEFIKQFWTRPLLPGEVGCTLSHVRALEHVVANDVVSLVIEDDVVFRERFPAACAALSAHVREHRVAFDLIYLWDAECCEIGESMNVTTLLRKSRFVYTTTAYVVTPAAARTLLSTTIKKNVIPADEWLIACAAAHPNPHISRMFPPVLTNVLTAVNDEFVALRDCPSTIEHGDSPQGTCQSTRDSALPVLPSASGVPTDSS